MYHNRVRGVSSEGIILLYLASEVSDTLGHGGLVHESSIGLGLYSFGILLSKLLVYPLIDPEAVPYVIPFAPPLFRSLDCGSHGLYRI